ncbi:MAG TPA: NF038120 family PEP-CTERM protein [Telluria sp.]|nr:NF038120 family PEP-CTERM protein [Telluria sp.]
MKKIVSLALAMAVATVCSSASAGVVTFEGFIPSISSNGDTLVNGNEVITTRGQGGFDGAIIDGTDPFRCDITVCPAGSTYYAGLNDGGLSFGLSGNAFNLGGLDFAFILPVDGLIDFTVGQLIATGSDGSVVSKDFAMQVNGQYGFAHWNFDGLFAQTRFTEVSFSACLYTDVGTCVNPAGNQAQFAIDNIAYVPEPGSVPLIALSLLGMLAAYRRKSA